MKAFACVLALVFVETLAAQSSQILLREADFSTTPERGGLRFTPQFPPVQQIAGAPAAFYSCFWEFGDGNFSFEENPLHSYPEPGTYTAILDLTNNYDDGKKPRKKKRPVPGGGKGAMAGVFERDRQVIALKTNCQPRSGDPLTCIVSYRNNSALTTGGRIHLFFNEKKYPAAHFRYDTARTYFGETAENAYTLPGPAPAPVAIDWAALTGMRSTGVSTLLSAEPRGADATDMLEKARRVYREEQVWRFAELRPGELRNLFVDLSGTANMLKDTSAFIHLEGIFEPFDPLIAPERFELEIEIVSSHDPNAIFVSDNRVNYRFLKRQKLDYKVRFQNNGEGPAHTVQLDIEIPEGLDLARMRPVEWYPQCPICPTPPGTGSCLDTASTRNGLVFTFRNIYLPGSRQNGLTDRDSTKGFVKYRIEPEPHMPKRTFRSRAKIVFDKNPPIYTNYSKTRFKHGLSPGLKAGYGFSTDAFKAGYFFIGASVSPYKSWKIYPQLEVLTGLKGRANLVDITFSDSIVVPDVDLKVVTRRDSTIGGSRGFVSFEIPVLLRKNVSRAFGVGLGASARILLDNGEDTRHVTVTRYFSAPPGVFTPPPSILRDDHAVTSYSATSARVALFGDVTVGSVRAGPNLGIRFGVIGGAGQVEPFVQVAAEMKF